MKQSLELLERGIQIKSVQLWMTLIRWHLVWRIPSHISHIQHFHVCNRSRIRCYGMPRRDDCKQTMHPRKLNNGNGSFDLGSSGRRTRFHRIFPTDTQSTSIIHFIFSVFENRK